MSAVPKGPPPLPSQAPQQPKEEPKLETPAEVVETVEAMPLDEIEEIEATEPVTEPPAPAAPVAAAEPALPIPPVEPVKPPAKEETSVNASSAKQRIAAAKAAALTTPLDVPPKKPSGSSAGIAWLVAVIIATGGITAFYSIRSDLGDERTAHADTQANLDTSRSEAVALQARISVLEAERVKLAAQTAQLAEDARVKAEALEAMTRTQEELLKQLEEEVSKGGVLISQQHGELVVDLIDQVVFDSGEAELNARGKKVLKQVGETLAKVPDKIIQVSGHTDNLNISKRLVKQFPTNWELSTARATNVVRYLQDEIKIPGNRLVAAGAAEFRPIARNTTNAGRSKNRRIEVRLLPMPKKS